MADSHPLIAYQIFPQPPSIGLEPAPISRTWMDESPQRFAYRCLPLNIANQNGWILTCPCAFRAYWYGGPNPTDTVIEFDAHRDPAVTSHFGVGVITFSLPFVFRTPPGINLWVKGPSNFIKDGIQALEGVVETDWAASTFTMNWKLTREGEWVAFQKGEPICMVVPVPRGLTEAFDPRIEYMATNPELQAEYRAWEASRSGFLKGLKSNDPGAVKLGWQKDYFQGKQGSGGTFDSHQTRLTVKEFVPPPPAG